MSTPDIFEEMERDARARLQAGPSADQSSRLTALGQELAKIEDWVQRAEALIKQRNERAWEIKTKELVDVMLEAGQDLMGLPGSGVDLKLEDYYRASLPNPDTLKEDTPERDRAEELRGQALNWLEENGHEDIISTTLTVTMPKGSLELANKIRDELIAKYSVPNDADTPAIGAGAIKVAEGVHHMTLTSWLKGQDKKAREAGRVLDLPLEALGATIGKIVKIIKRKER